VRSVKENCGTHSSPQLPALEVQYRTREERTRIGCRSLRLALPRRFPPPGKMHVSTRPDTFTSRSAQASSRTRPARGVYRRPQSHTHRPQRDIQRPWIAVRGRKANLRAIYKSPTLPPLSRTVTLHAPKRMVSTSRSQRTPHAHVFQPENRPETNAHAPPHPPPRVPTMPETYDPSW
jgi:hypothetical protein